MLKKVMVRLRLTSPPSNRHQTLLPEPPGEHDEQIRPKPNNLSSRSSVIDTQKPICIGEKRIEKEQFFMDLE